MDYTIVWAESSLEDLRQIVRYISMDNNEAATRVGTAIIHRVETLSEFPRLGRKVPELAEDSMRQIVMSPYRIVYEVNDHKRLVSIIRIWHGARGDLEL